MKLMLIVAMAGLLGLACAASVDQDLLKRLIAKLETDKRSADGDLDNESADKRQLYGAKWNADTGIVTMYPQRTKTCWTKNECFFQLFVLDSDGKEINEFPVFQWENGQDDYTLRIPLEELMTPASGSSKQRAFGDDDNNDIKPPQDNLLVLKMCRLVGRNDVRPACNKKTLNLNKDKDSVFH